MKKSDWYIIAVGLLLAVAIYGGLKVQQMFLETDHKTVVVYSDGEPIDEVDISIDGVYTYTTDFGYNEFEVVDGEVKMVDADCPELTCLHDGPIAHVNETIVCLPNRFHLQVVGVEEGEVEIDAISE